MDRELNWKRGRVGLITASELGDLVSASGKITNENVSYVRKKRFERSRGFSLPIFGRALDMGKEQEQYAVAWFRENYPDIPIVYAQEEEVIPMWKANWGNFAASPDCFSPDETLVIEIKSVVGNTAAEFFSDEHTSYEAKMKAVVKDHWPQLAGQFLSNPKVKEIWLLKYIYQRDDVPDDIDSPLEKWRGVIFKFKRSDFDLDFVKDRILAFDAYIDSSYDADAFKTAEWAKNGSKIEFSWPEPKPKKASKD